MAPQTHPQEHPQKIYSATTSKEYKIYQPNADKMALSWGIAGAGRISHDFVTAVRTLPETDHQFIAVAGRSQQKVEQFAADHNIPKSYNAYEKLAEDNEIDIVYVGNLNIQHFEVCKLMMEHGKHVLCEKPFTMNEKQTSKLVQIAKEKKLFIMEAVWSRCFPAYKKLREIIDSGAIGEVLFCSASFGHDLQENHRFSSLDLGGSAILDLGIYVLQFQQYVFRGLKPIKIAVSGHMNSGGPDESAGAIITYPGGKMAVISTSSRLVLPNEGYVVGTKGTLKLPSFWCPTELVSSETTYKWALPETSVPFLHINSGGLAYEAEEVRQCIKKGLIESPNITHDESVELARLMDIMRKQIGVVFREDSQEV